MPSVSVTCVPAESDKGEAASLLKLVIDSEARLAEFIWRSDVQKLQIPQARITFPNEFRGCGC